MTGTGRWRAFECRQCHEQVFLRIEPSKPTPSGVLIIDTDKLIRAMHLHMRTGCRAGPARPT